MARLNLSSSVKPIDGAAGNSGIGETTGGGIGRMLHNPAADIVVRRLYQGPRLRREAECSLP